MNYAYKSAFSYLRTWLWSLFNYQIQYFSEKIVVLFLFHWQDIMSYHFLMLRTFCPIQGLEIVKHNTFNILNVKFYKHDATVFRQNPKIRKTTNSIKNNKLLTLNSNEKRISIFLQPIVFRRVSKLFVSNLNIN